MGLGNAEIALYPSGYIFVVIKPLWSPFVESGETKALVDCTRIIYALASLGIAFFYTDRLLLTLTWRFS